MRSMSLSLFAAPSASETPANILAASRALAPHLARSRARDRRLVSSTLTTCFGATDAEGAWSWRDAYDACEAALVLQMRRLAPQVGRLEDAPVEVVQLLARLAELSLTHTRRSEEQVALDQFSTPPALAALAALAGQIRPDDRVLEPSAGTGLLAVIAEACGAKLALNEVSTHRAAMLDGLFPATERTRHDAAHLRDVLPGAGAFDAVVCNPPFGTLREHLLSALACLAEGGRLSAIVPVRAFTDSGLMAALSARGRVVEAVAFPERAFAKHGTGVDTGLLVIDRLDGGGTWSGEVGRTRSGRCGRAVGGAAASSDGASARVQRHGQRDALRPEEPARGFDLLGPACLADRSDGGGLRDAALVGRGARRRPLPGLRQRPDRLRRAAAPSVGARGVRADGVGAAARSVLSPRPARRRAG